MKFTAGLHHPLRHFDEGVQAEMHGFLNVFVAGILVDSRGVSEDTIREILATEDLDSFEFSADVVAWRGNRATLAEIATARQRTVTTLGSCSFDEPREDLRNLGLL